MATIEKRFSRDGKPVYRVKIRLKGYPAQESTHQRLTDAKKWAASVESAIREGRHFEVSESKKRTLADLIDKYIKDEMPKLRSDKARAVHLEWWRQKLGPFTLSDIRPARIIEARKDLLAKQSPRGSALSPSTVNRYCASLSSVFTWGVKEAQWATENPFFKIKFLDEPDGLDRFLTPDERERLIDACEAHSKALLVIVLVAISTGARRNEILSLRWPEVDLKAGLLTFARTKNGKIRHVPIRGKALTLVKELAAEKMMSDPQGLVFPGTKEVTKTKPLAIENIFKAALKAADIKGFRFHDLRHSAASELVMAGIDMRTVAEILGHSDLKMTQRYSHLSRPHVENAISRLDAVMFGGAGE